MKSLKKTLPLLIMAVFMTIGMTSCLSDSDNDDVLTPEQDSQYRSMINGTYYGKMYFYDRSNTAKTSYFYNDSITDMALRQYAADSTIVIDFFSRH